MAKQRQLILDFNAILRQEKIYKNLGTKPTQDRLVLMIRDFVNTYGSKKETEFTTLTYVKFTKLCALVSEHQPIPAHVFLKKIQDTLND